MLELHPDHLHVTIYRLASVSYCYDSRANVRTSPTSRVASDSNDESAFFIQQFITAVAPMPRLHPCTMNEHARYYWTVETLGRPASATTRNNSVKLL